MPFSVAFAMRPSFEMRAPSSRGEIGPERVGAARGDAAPQLDGPAALAAELRAPRPQPAGREVERVLVREADRAVDLVDEAGRDPRGFAHAHLRDGDLEAGVDWTLTAHGRQLCSPVRRAKRLL